MFRTQCNHRNRQQGTVAVEVALTMPILVLVMLVGMNFGQALTTRHRLADAAGLATRTGAITQQTGAATIRALIIERLGPAAARCNAINVISTVVPSLAGTSRLEVQALCVLAPAFGAALMPGIGPNTVAVTAAMPM